MKNHQMDINFAHVTLEGLNNFAGAHTLLDLTPASFASLKMRLKELNVSNLSHEPIYSACKHVEHIKQNMVIRKLFLLSNLGMKNVSVSAPFADQVLPLCSSKHTNSTFTFIFSPDDAIDEN